ncbi:related to oxidase [Rhynchosporium agropyri]|uniref:Related to oxidase n=1 Tax=Rhynchosporium agropyri TaxID=914238 RepID=A0A1E1KMQ7_9HELO|nr:related to oxidase [Rhynchosporium agropyri]
MITALLVLALSFTVSAYPGMSEGNLNARQAVPPVPLPLSQNEGNCGIIPCTTFNAADQLVDVRPGTLHQFVAPRSSDKRGPCPGLNAAANHGFVPHSGIATVAQREILILDHHCILRLTFVLAVTDGIVKAFNFSPALATALSTIGLVLTGDVLGGTWSIGGPYPGSLLGSLLSSPEGLSFSHNAYETDGSMTRGDDYMTNGDAYSLQMDRFMALYNRSELYTLDIVRQHNKAMRDWSIQNNPYYFSAPFAGLVTPIAHTLVPLAFSNHSASNIQGYLDRSILKSFFSISGPESALVYTPGHERIPLNWYRRPTNNQLGIVNGFADLGVTATRFPDLISIGGNTGTVNSFVGVNPADISGGIFNAANLLQGNNLACFSLQIIQAETPSLLTGLVSALGLSTAISLLNNVINPTMSSLGCPTMNAFNSGAFAQFPGSGYHPHA